MKKILLVITLCAFNFGCSGFGKKMKAWVSGKSEPQVTRKKVATKFSENPYHQAGPKRHYKRSTKKSIEQNSKLDANTGSLWVMEGQGAYLFSQNVVRMIGDSTSIRIEGEPREQLQAKAKIINDLLEKLEQRKRASMRRVASTNKSKPKGKEVAKTNAPAQNPRNTPNQNANQNPGEEAFGVKVVPTRITERMIDGNYRVKGSQPFMIGKREYKVIVTGIVRSQDFNEEGVSATKLLDPSFDIVSTRRSSTKL